MARATANKPVSSPKKFRIKNIAPRRRLSISDNSSPSRTPAQFNRDLGDIDALHLDFDTAMASQTPLADIPAAQSSHDNATAAMLADLGNLRRTENFSSAGAGDLHMGLIAQGVMNQRITDYADNVRNRALRGLDEEAGAKLTGWHHFEASDPAPDSEALKFESIAGGQTHRRAQVPTAPIRAVAAPAPVVKPTLRLPTSDLALSKHATVPKASTGRAGGVKTNWRRQPGGPATTRSEPINIGAVRSSTVRIDDSGDEADEEVEEGDDEVGWFVGTSGVPPADDY
ncbi:hypothetical protein EJ08DRAFT_703199 [Tothia fuscella]|uniref:Uncharacterized protein n=1 Tax=Tothia fuscella TaxID=1048955 RepID=A0A9P4NES3_9PEZI|nr:hypothetical protein EJ08DRAFT_703199 [Tothia fuscella]